MLANQCAPYAVFKKSDDVAINRLEQLADRLEAVLSGLCIQRTQIM
jgi:hypothetical protein